MLRLCQIDESVPAELVNETAETLNKLCREGQLQTFGFHVAVAPYVYHTPAISW